MLTYNIADLCDRRLPFLLRLRNRCSSDGITGEKRRMENVGNILYIYLIEWDGRWGLSRSDETRCWLD